MNRRTVAGLLLLVGAAALAACESPTAFRPAFAYDPTTLSNGQLYRWEHGRTLRVWADLTDSTSGVDLGRSVRRAMASWSALTDFDEFDFVMTADPANADILVFDRSRPLPITPGACPFDPSGAGYTYFCPSAGSPARADRLVLSAGRSSTATVVIRVDRERISSQDAYDALVAHEFGHALGIGAHSAVSTDVMFGLPTTALPSLRDAQTLQFVLGSRADILL